jgi:hypothetical protein
MSTAEWLLALERYIIYVSPPPSLPLSLLAPSISAGDTSNIFLPARGWYPRHVNAGDEVIANVAAYDATEVQ